MKRFFLISVALAAAYGLGEAEFGSARAGKAKTEKVTGKTELTPAQVANTTGTQKAQLGCNLIDAEYELTGEHVCTLGNVTRYCVTVDAVYEKGAYLEVFADLQMTLVPGEPE